MATDTTRFKFTEHRLKSSIAAAKANTTLLDTECKGLQLRIQGGSASYVVRYRVAGAGASSSKRLTLGRFEQITLADARKAASSAIANSRNGYDPLAQRRAAAATTATSISLAEFLIEYADYQERQGIVSAPDKIKALKNHCASLLRLPLADITRRQWVERLDKIAAKHPASAVVVRACVHHVYEIARDRGVLQQNPLANRRAQRGSIKNKNIAKAKAAKVLSIDDLARIWVAAGKESVNPAFGCYVRTMIATGARRTELSLALLSDFHEPSGEFPARLTLRPETTKTGVNHIVYLPHLIASEIERLPRSATARFLFPGRPIKLRQVPMLGWSDLIRPLRAAAVKLGVTEKIHFHGIRKGFRTGLSAIRVDRVVAEKMLAHASGDKMIEIYDQHEFEKERAEASQRWCDALAVALDKVLLETGKRNHSVTDISQARAARAAKARRR